jgi:hypothetical protein
MDRQVLNDRELRVRWLTANLDRAPTGPIYSDEFIERQGGVYLDNPILRMVGVPFSAFLAFPNVQLWLDAAAHARFAHRMHKAEAAIAQAERAEGHGENGRLVEKIRHRAYPRSYRNFTPVRDA